MPQTPEERAAALDAGRQKAIELRKAKAALKMDRKPDIDDDFSAALKATTKWVREIAENGFKMTCVRCQKEFGGGDTLKDLYSFLIGGYDKLYRNEPVTLKQEWNYNMKVVNRDTGELHVPFKDRIIDAEVVKDESSVDKP